MERWPEPRHPLDPVSGKRSSLLEEWEALFPSSHLARPPHPLPPSLNLQNPGSALYKSSLNPWPQSGPASFPSVQWARDGDTAVNVVCFSLTLLCRLGSTKGKEPKASEDQVLADPETKVGVQMRQGRQWEPVCMPHSYLCPIFVDHGKGFSIQNTQDSSPSSTKPYTNGAASTDQVRCLFVHGAVLAKQM